MTFERCYMNWEEGVGICCWDAASKEELGAMFKKAGTPFDTMVEVKEYPAEALIE